MTIQSNEFNVAIVGASVAGLALVMALHRTGVPFTICEEAKEYSVVGRVALRLILSKCITREPYSQLLQRRYRVRPKCDDKPWNGDRKSAWGHKDYVRKSAGIPLPLK
ncbi:uncharacterized protein FOBCDRAFT_323293 [Fusarium oxysporum Fo47]|uniref:uncharacterized protein n=1 Tax=Fusarium oxysporum Fo47 TaxID=660027 RepID=UPI0015987A39|nr:uncharacterized protein FOBCDRAFT_323293 [Fusarium oxysporum Fo47]QKD60107.1 hypothetical protein FOBCDRAFT_323293 [Fusarium oxysporum Fo47]